MKPLETRPLTVLFGVFVFGATFIGLGMSRPQETPCLTLTDEEEAILDALTLSYPGGTPTITLGFFNLQIVNGNGSTNGPVNGVGNLIVGYNETGNTLGDDRTGSHNVVLGSQNSYSSYGGIVSGTDNAIRGAYSVALGGTGNVADGHYSVVSGGSSNIAYAAQSSIAGGNQNTTEVAAESAVITGGASNRALGFTSAVHGGAINAAQGGSSAVCGGSTRQTTLPYSWVAGSLFQSQ